MSDRIDHAAEARLALEGSGDGRNFATDASVNAVAHSILALAEQQRIANLIALAQTSDDHEDSLGILRAEAADTLVQWVPHGPDDEHQEIRPEIAEALGIKAGDNDE